MYLIGGGCNDHGGQGPHKVVEQQPLAAVLSSGRAAVAAFSAPGDLQRGGGDLLYPGRPRACGNNLFPTLIEHPSLNSERPSLNPGWHRLRRQVIHRKRIYNFDASC
jgi:hypothetical protein